MVASVETGRQQRVLILCFAPAIQSAIRIRPVMANANGDYARLPADPAFTTLPSRVVTRGSFRGIPARERLAPSIAGNELKKLAESGRAPHPISNPAKLASAPIATIEEEEESGEELVSPDILDGLRVMAAQGRVPHPIWNPAKPGRITAWNDTTDEEALEGNYYYKLRPKIFYYFLFD
jgi:hypothetical protein